MALDVRHRDHPGAGGDHRPLLHHREPSWLHIAARSTGGSGGDSACWCASRSTRPDLAGARIDNAATGHGQQSYAALFAKRNLRATILASVPWFLQDLGTYGIGIFTPTILAAAFGAKQDHVRSVTDLIAQRHHSPPRALR
jgi:putative MFS transporter